jgi:chaperonin GroEL (HSP60 family)
MASALRKYAETVPGREQLAVRVFAEALESITVTLAENAGVDPIDILVDLRSRHDKGETWAGIEVLEGKIQDMSKVNIFEPLSVKKQIIKSANEAASMILKIDDIISATKMKAPPMPPGGMGGGMGGMGGMGGYPGMGE